MIGRPGTSLSLRLPPALAAAALLLLPPAAQAAVQDRKPPTTPSNLTITATTAYSVSLAWGASTDNSGSLSYRVLNTTRGLDALVAGTETTFTWSSKLQPLQTYSFSIYAVDAAGNRSKTSNTVTATLPGDTTAPLAPQISVTDAGPTHLSLAWTAPDDDPQLTWLLFMNGTMLSSGSKSSMIVAPLTPATTYTFAVQGRDDGGNWSPLSAPLSVATEPSDPDDTTPPTTPAGFWGGAVDNCEVILYWGASSDDVTPPEFLRYDLYVNGLHVNGTTLGITQVIEYGTVDGPNLFELFAVDAAGNASAPAAVIIDLFACIPPQ
ncbi:MAG TPA: fibronectin type III domain-containing protein [Candidatus Polarisedimenticolia bacterium]|nr:fibronectin type III domain-containing protein [Candidatus Polarisedimenticolia bacterium]